MRNIKIKSTFTNDEAYVYFIYNKELKQGYIGSSFFNLRNRYNYDEITNTFQKDHHSSFALDDSLILNPDNWEFKILHTAKSKSEMKYYEGFFIEYLKVKGYQLYNSRTFDYNGSISYITNVSYTKNDLLLIDIIKDSILNLSKEYNNETDDYKKKSLQFQIKNLENRLNHMAVYRSIVNRISKITSK